MKASEPALLQNSQRPRDDTLPAHELRALESMIDPISGVLRVIGNDPSPREDDDAAGAVKGPKKLHMHSTKVRDLIEAGMIEPGSVVASTSPGYPAEATITVDGAFQWNGESYQTPSAAGCAVRDGRATNGWNFWALQTETGSKPLALLRATYEEQKSSTG